MYLKLLFEIRRQFDRPSNVPYLSIKAVFTHVMLCYRGISHDPVFVCVSVCLSQVVVLLKRLNIESLTEETSE